MDAEAQEGRRKSPPGSRDWGSDLGAEKEWSYARGGCRDLGRPMKCFFDLRIVGSIEFVPWPPMPGPLRLTVISEDRDMLQFKLVLPAPGAPDVVSRELSVKVGEGDAVVQPLAPDALEVVGFEGADNAVVAVSLVDIDDAGNRSEAREQQFTLTDTIAPPQPGEIGLQVTAEV